MKYYAVGVLLIAFLVGAVTVSVQAAREPSRCATGEVRGFAEVQGDPRLGGIGALPGLWTGTQEFFSIRYNCTGRGVLAKRVDEGVYDVMFPGNSARVAVVSAVNQQGASASVDRIADGVFRITIRGPVVDNSILIRRELPFYIAIF